MKKIVITGGTRGIGNGLARAFLQRGCSVMISSRSRKNLENCLDNIRGDFPGAEIKGAVCDVRDLKNVEALWDLAKKQWGHVDIWINNAGISNPLGDFWKIDPRVNADVIQTNIIGSLNGSSVALNGFIKQGSGALYNLEGLGSKDNRTVQGQSVYGTTKAAMYYFDKALANEVNYPNVIIGALQPGMVLTDMVTGQYKDNPQEWEKVKGILTFLSEDLTVVCEWLADKILANKKNGARLAYSSPARLLLRFLRKIFRKNYFCRRLDSFKDGC